MIGMDLIYLDNNASTMMDPRVCQAMLPWLGEGYANPSSIHYFGQQARHAVETAREQVAAAIGARPRQIIFTSGGTEANNLAIQGTLAAQPDKRHLVTTAVEHESVLAPLRRLERRGYSLTCVGVDRQGRIDPGEFEAALTDRTALASVMHANNETGVIFPIETLGQITRQRGIPLHVDATQTVGKLPIDVTRLPVELLSMSAHKFHGPKGVGALCVRPGLYLEPELVGGHQEHGLRAGTENVAGIVGLGSAISLAVEHLEEDAAVVRRLRDRLEAGILDRVPAASIIGDRRQRLANTSTVAFESIQAEAILMLLSNAGVCASSGAACSSGSLEPSHVLLAMSVAASLAHGAVRFSLSRFTTQPEVERAIEVVAQTIDRLRSLQPLGQSPPAPLTM